MRTSYPLRQTRVVCGVDGWCVAIARISAPRDIRGTGSDISVVAGEGGWRREESGERWDGRSRDVLRQATDGGGDARHDGGEGRVLEVCARRISRRHYISLSY
jgi:hypothetical protein